MDVDVDVLGDADAAEAEEAADVFDAESGLVEGPGGGDVAENAEAQEGCTRDRAGSQPIVRAVRRRRRDRELRIASKPCNLRCDRLRAASDYQSRTRRRVPSIGDSRRRELFIKALARHRG